MAWGGKVGNMNWWQRRESWRKPRPLPQRDPERDVLKQLGREQLPLSKQAYQVRYNELMAQKAKE